MLAALRLAVVASIIGMSSFTSPAAWVTLGGLGYLGCNDHLRALIHHRLGVVGELEPIASLHHS